MDVAHILLVKLLLYHVDVKNFVNSNTYAFVYNRENLVLIPSSKNQYENKKNGFIIDKKCKIPLHSVHMSIVIDLIEYVGYMTKEFIDLPFIQ